MSDSQDGFHGQQPPGRPHQGPPGDPAPRWDRQRRAPESAQWQQDGPTRWDDENSADVGGWRPGPPTAPPPAARPGGRRTGGGEYSGQGEGYENNAPSQRLFRDEPPTAPPWQDQPSAPPAPHPHAEAETQQYVAQPEAETQQYVGLPDTPAPQAAPPATPYGQQAYDAPTAAYGDYDYPPSQPAPQSGGPSAGWDKAAPRAPRGESLLSAVLKPSVDSALTVRLARPLMLGAIVVAGLAWLLTVIAAFTSDGGNGGLMGGLTLITGGVFALFFVATFRVWLEGRVREATEAEHRKESAQEANAESGSPEDPADHS